MSLPASERARLAERLIASLDEDSENGTRVASVSGAAETPRRIMPHPRGRAGLPDTGHLHMNHPGEETPYGALRAGAMPRSRKAALE